MGSMRDGAEDLEFSEPADAGGQSFHGEILVSSRIIDQLSTGLYETPAACLKELVNNAYDADAVNVTISVRPDADVIIINDDGVGLTRQDFTRHFSRIAESRKRDLGESTLLGRPKIGKIGIGFIAANEICDQMELISTTAGSPDVVRVVIDFKSMRKDPAVRRREGQDLAKGDYDGRVEPTADIDEHYTRVYLRDVRGQAREILSGAVHGRSGNSLYGLGPDSIRDRLAKVQKSWDEFDSYSQAMLDIALNVPVRYHDRWLPDEDEYRERVRPITEKVAKFDFNVVIDGTSLRKPIVLQTGNDGRSLLHVFKLQGDHVSANGYLYASSGKLAPHDLNGVLVRIRNAAVGAYDRSFLEYPSWIDSLFQTWVTCELYADDRLEESLNIDRKTLRTTDPAYVELQSLFHEELKEFLNRVRSDIYQERSSQRQHQRAKEQSKRLESVRDRLTPSIGEAAARDIIDRLQKPPEARGRSQRRTTQESTEDAPGEPIDVRMLNKKFTPAEIMDIVSAAATNAGLSPQSINTLLIEIARRLREQRF